MLLQLDLTKKLNILYKIVGTTYYKGHNKEKRGQSLILYNIQGIIMNMPKNHLKLMILKMIKTQRWH